MTAHLRKHRERLESRATVSPMPLLPAFLEAHPGPLPGSGRGIVTSAGPAYQCSAYVLFRLLRHVGCNLPIECWYLGEEERDDRFADLVAPLGVTMVDALAKGFELINERPSFEADRSGKPSSYTPTAVNGYALKPFALLHSAFQEVLWLDADNCPAADPAGLFDSAEYQQTGALFWPDAPTRRLHKKACQAFSVAWRDEREFETGQIVLDKARCREALLTTWFLNLHRAWSYRYSWGDKDTFQVGWWLAAAEYWLAGNAGGGSGVFVQHDPAGKPLFWHRSCGTHYGANSGSAGFPLHDVAMRAVEHVKSGAIHTQNHTRRQIRIAAYDRPHYLRETLAHLKRCRGLEAFQIVASVDARPDGTHNPEVVDLCRQVTSDVRLRPRLGCNRHTHVNLQEGASEADWLFLLEDDIVLSREALEWCLANEGLLVNETPDLVHKSRSQVNKAGESVNNSPPNSMCLIGHKAENATDRRDELAVWDYFCAWGMYFSPAGLRRALELWQPEWDDKPRLTWDCYLSDAGWLQLMPHVPRAKNIGRIGAHCRSDQDFADADRQHWIDDGPTTWCFFINGPDRKEYLIRDALPSHIAAFDRVVVLDKTGQFQASCEVQQVPLDNHPAAYQAMVDLTADGDWICWLDADEALNGPALEVIHRKELEGDAYEIHGCNFNFDPRTDKWPSSPGVNHNWVKRNLVRKLPDTRPQFVGSHCSLTSGPDVQRLPGARCYYAHRKSRPEYLYGLFVHGLLWPEGHNVAACPKLLAGRNSLFARWNLNEARLNELLHSDAPQWWHDLRSLGGFEHEISHAIAEYCDQHNHQHVPFPVGVDPIAAAVTPWPKKRPAYEFNDFGWLQPEVEAELLRRIPRASLIVELGSFLGKSARFMLDNSRARLIAVDTWLGSPELVGHETMTQWGADLFERFVANCWDYRERLTIVRHTTSAALRHFHQVGLRPDLIYVDASHQREDACLDVTLCRRLFPDAVLVGDDWMWETVQQGVADAGLVPTSVEGTCWVYDPVS